MSQLRSGCERLQCALFACFGVVALLVACGGSGSENPERGSIDAALESATQADSLQFLIASLGQLAGSFEEAGPAGSWRFRGDRSIIRAIVSFEEDAVMPLVECLDDMRPAAATVGGRPVPRGVMCYEALSVVAIYEAVDEQGGLDPNWPGHIIPTAGQTDLVAAKTAWRDVVARRAYSIP